jgi:hypothetical protein
MRNEGWIYVVHTHKDTLRRRVCRDETIECIFSSSRIKPPSSSFVLLLIYVIFAKLALALSRISHTGQGVPWHVCTLWKEVFGLTRSQMKLKITESIYTKREYVKRKWKVFGVYIYYEFSWYPCIQMIQFNQPLRRCKAGKLPITQTPSKKIFNLYSSIFPSLNPTYLDTNHSTVARISFPAAPTRGASPIHVFLPVIDHSQNSRSDPTGWYIGTEKSTKANMATNAPLAPPARTRLFDGLELPASGDFHVHLRDGEMMAAVATTIAKGGVDAVFVMVSVFLHRMMHFYPLLLSISQLCVCLSPGHLI